MIYKSGDSKNPVGPESPTFAFPFSKGQVLVALLVVAIGLTAWKQYEANSLAPQSPVQWQPFSIEAVEKAAQRRAYVLIVLDPVDPGELQNLNRRLTSAEFQKTVYMTRPLPIRIASLSSLDEASAHWLADHVGNLSPGNIIWFPKGDWLNCRVFSATDFDKAYPLLNLAD